MTTPHQLIRRTLTGVIAITCLSLAVTGCGTADNSAEPQKPATTETQKPATTETQKTETKEQTPDPEPETTVQQVIDHAKQISGKFGDLCSYTVPGDRDSTYRYIGLNNLIPSGSELSNADLALTTAIQEGLHWDDTHTSEENQQQINNMDTAYQTWETSLWKAMGTGVSHTTDGLKQQLETMPTEGMADSCKQAPPMAATIPDNVTDTEEEYVALRDWMNQVIDQLNQCQADMSAYYASQGQVR